MSNQNSLRAHYDSLETAALIEMWARGGQMDWAEELLLEELRRRAVSDELLTQLQLGREELNTEIAKQQDRFQLRAMGGFVALFLSITLGAIAGSLLGQRAAFITIATVFFLYGILLVRVMGHLKNDAQAGGSSVSSMGSGILQMITAFGLSGLCVWAAIALKL